MCLPAFVGRRATVAEDLNCDVLREPADVYSGAEKASFTEPAPAFLPRRRICRGSGTPAFIAALIPDRAMVGRRSRRDRSFRYCKHKDHPANDPRNLTLQAHFSQLGSRSRSSRSVTIDDGRPYRFIVRFRNFSAARRSRRFVTKTSSTSPSWSTARHRASRTPRFVYSWNVSHR